MFLDCLVSCKNTNNFEGQSMKSKVNPATILGSYFLQSFEHVVRL